MKIKQLQPKLDLAREEYADAHRRKFNLAGRTTFTETATSVQIQSLLPSRTSICSCTPSPATTRLVLVVLPPGEPITGTYLTQSDGKSPSFR